jgi:A/G-specific adenine glycosylase
LRRAGFRSLVWKRHVAVQERSAKAHRAIRAWYRRFGRDLPWRKTRDPYAVLVSETMLQQTKVDRVTPKYERFLMEFPTLCALARAKFARVLRAWSGLGYNGRARRLWECAKTLVRWNGGRLPQDPTVLSTLPGVGRYTAAAIASFAFDKREPVVDTNVRRVLSRSILGVDDAGMPRAWKVAAQVLPRSNARDWNQALMDVGALFCRPKPRCAHCPAASFCLYRRRKPAKRRIAPAVARERAAPYIGSRRYYRGRIVKALVSSAGLRLPDLGEQVKPGFDQSELPWLRALIHELVLEHLLALDARTGLVRIA